MYLTHLSLTNFRSFTRLDMDMPRQSLLLVGDNAQGKTSILEAIYYLATFTSFHAQNDRQLINFLAAQDALPVCRLVGEFSRGGQNRRLEVRLILDPVSGGINQQRFRKEILVDGIKRSQHEAIGNLSAVLFLPQMTRIIEGGPEERRRFLNMTLSQVVPKYAQSLLEYTQAITQRNALLKQLAERGGDPDELVYWDTLVANRGAFLLSTRIVALQEIERHAARVHQFLTNTQEVLSLLYQPSYDPLPAIPEQIALPLKTAADRSNIPLEQIKQSFLQRLTAVRSEDIARGVTSLGPHRDELRFLSNGIDLGNYGSRGQIRTALLALKLAEVNWMKERTGQWPLLLLDEILAELDTQRRADLLAILDECEQSLLTTTDLHLFTPQFVQQSTVWQVEAGRVCLPARE